MLVRVTCNAANGANADRPDPCSSTSVTRHSSLVMGRSRFAGLRPGERGDPFAMERAIHEAESLASALPEQRKRTMEDWDVELDDIILR